MADTYLNRERRAFLVAIRAGRIYWSNGSGKLMWRKDGLGQNTRAEGRAREAVAAGWARETGDHERPYELTGAGHDALDGAR